MNISINGWKSGKIGIFPVLMISAIFISLLAQLSGAVPSGREKEVFGYVHEALISMLGIGLFFFGFKNLRKKRMVDNTPTSKIRSVAMGLCEVVGFAKTKFPLISPLTGTACVFYKFKVETERSNSKGGKHWHTDREECSTNYFYVEDNTGKLLVDPLCSEPMLVVDYKQIVGRKSILSHRTRHTEWLLKADEYVYVLGSVKKFKDHTSEHKNRLVDKLRELKEDKAKLLKEYDTDQDGQISVEEWDRAREQIEQQLLEEEIKKPAEADDDIVITQGEVEKTFIISDRDEKEVSRKISLRSFASVFGGASLFILMLVSFLANIGILSRSCRIPWELFYR